MPNRVIPWLLACCHWLVVPGSQTTPVMMTTDGRRVVSLVGWLLKPRAEATNWPGRTGKKGVARSLLPHQPALPCMPCCPLFLPALSQGACWWRGGGPGVKSLACRIFLQIFSQLACVRAGPPRARTCSPSGPKDLPGASGSLVCMYRYPATTCRTTTRVPARPAVEWLWHGDHGHGHGHGGMGKALL